MKLFRNLIFALLFFSCDGGNENQNKLEMEKEEKIELDYLVFEFHDSSVPPPYHRSYSLKFKDESVQIVVDSYGEIMTDTVLNIGKDIVDQAFELVKKCKIRSKSTKEESDGCTGGTGVSVNYGVEDKINCKGYVYFCAGEQFGDLSGDLNSLKYGLKELIPNFSRYLKED